MIDNSDAVFPAQVTPCVIPAKVTPCVIPAKAGTQSFRLLRKPWIPASAGMTTRKPWIPAFAGMTSPASAGMTKSPQCK